MIREIINDWRLTRSGTLEVEDLKTLTFIFVVQSAPSLSVWSDDNQGTKIIKKFSQWTSTN